MDLVYSEEYSSLYGGEDPPGVCEEHETAMHRWRLFREGVEAYEGSESRAIGMAERATLEYKGVADLDFDRVVVKSDVEWSTIPLLRQHVDLRVRTIQRSYAAQFY